MTNFITGNIEKTIKINVIEKTYPNLNHQHQNILNNYLYGLIQMVATCYGFYNDRNKFLEKLRQNSYKDLRWLLTFLLPYMDNKVKKISELKDFNELYSLRYDKLDESTRHKLQEMKIEDINITAPKYVFTNIQYGRCIRGDSNSSLKFSEKHLKDNYYLLLNTILTMRNKMYINWIDILPYRMDNYEKTELYLSTKDMIINKTLQMIDPVTDYPIEKVRDSRQIDLLNDKIKGLSVEDIYNTISLDLYESIVKYKWMLFEIGFKSEGANVIETLINVLKGIINLNNIMLGTEWLNLNDKAQERFIREWNILVSAYEKNYATVSKNASSDSETIKTIVKSFVVFFDKKYSKITAIRKNKDKKYIPLDRKIVKDDVDVYDERMKGVTDDMVLKTIKSIEYVYVYDFLLECIQGLKKTWYSLHMMSRDKTELLNTLGYKFIKDNKYITFKNVYNFCKSMVHESRTNKNKKTKKGQFGSDYIRFPRTWSELDDRSRNIILDRLNDKISDWFDIKNNMYHILKQVSPDSDDKTIRGQVVNDIKDLYRELRINITNIIFESTIAKGTLSYMVAETDLTDNAIYDMNILEQKARFVNLLKDRRFYSGNPYGDNSYYYLTEKPFNKTGTYFIKVDNTPEDFDYFKICSTVKTAWYIATTYHWIAQLGFCHKFINNRVNFITGGTGAGKSTQVPKLYMYYLKAIDRIVDPTVIVTVPRTNVATGISNFVSQELAVPFKEVVRKTGKDSKEKNENNYIQYKYMKDDNVDEGIYPKIRFITDGSVLMDAKDPLFKNKKVIDDQPIYSRNNKYDVVIIDEAHEHNTNMDMILTLMKNATYYNNKLRLVIMSATMDADEPIYRRFYRDINDNRKYPLNNWIKEHKIDRINTERRFHISPPDETTRFKITEYYRDGEDADKIVLEIINKSSTGDILLFRPGTKDISDSLAILNAPGVMPDDVIALPYHAQLPDHVKEFIDKIDKNLKDLRINKQENINSVTRSGLTTGNSFYKRCVLVATNIAEASISISTLRYVVDTGLEKTMKFDFESRSNILTTNYITDASRIQRKGRVGRVAPGTVFYTYKEGSLKNNVKQFNISIQDIHQSVMLELIRDPMDTPIITDLMDTIVSGFDVESKIQDTILKYNNTTIKIQDTRKERNTIKIQDIFFTYDDKTSKLVKRKDNKENTFEILNGTFVQDRNNILKLVAIDTFSHIKNSGKPVNNNTIEYVNSIVKIIDDHYISNNNVYEYYGNDEQYDYEYAVLPKRTYFSGFDIEQLTDSLGEFYMIHPDELVIKRNINGEIVGADQYQVISQKRSYDNFRQKMISNKIIVFWETLMNSAFVGVKTQSSGAKLISRTKLGEILRYCASNLTMFKDDSFIKMLFYGYGLSRNDEEFERVLNIVSILNVIGTENITRKIIDTAYVDHMVILNNNDTRIKIKIENDLRTSVKRNFANDYVNKSDIQILDSITNFIQSLFDQNKTEYNLFKSKWIKNNTFNGENIIDIQKGLPTDSMKKNMIPQKKDLSIRNELITNITNVHKKDLDDFIRTKTTDIRNNGLNIDIILQYVTNKEDIRRIWNDLIYDVKNIGDMKDMNINELKILLKDYRHLMDIHNIDIIKGILLLSKPYSIKRKIYNTTSSYISVYNPHPGTIMTLPPNSTFTDPHFYQDYILNLSENLEYKTMTTILDIGIEDITLLANIYNKIIMKRILTDKILTTDKKSVYMDNYIKDQYPKIINIDTNNTEIIQPVYRSKIDYRDYSIPEHIIAVSNLNKTSDIIANDIISIQSGEVFMILEKLGSEYGNYRKILQNV
jgi:hypothetical protein